MLLVKQRRQQAGRPEFAVTENRGLLRFAERCGELAQCDELAAQLGQQVICCFAFQQTFNQLDLKLAQGLQRFVRGAAVFV